MFLRLATGRILSGNQDSSNCESESLSGLPKEHWVVGAIPKLLVKGRAPGAQLRPALNLENARSDHKRSFSRPLRSPKMPGTFPPPPAEHFQARRPPPRPRDE